MNDRNSSMVDSARRLAELRRGQGEPSAAEAGDGLDFEAEEGEAAFTILSADRQHKLMVEFRLLNGNAKALAYSYLVALDMDPSEGIRMDFSGYTVAISGQNLRPLFDGLCAQRVAVVRESDPLQAEATAAPGATIVTAIEIKPVE